MRVSRQSVMYVLATVLACVCITSTTHLVFVSSLIGEACVFETVCDEWFVPLLILGMVLLVAAAVSGYGLFILVRGARARTTTGKLW